MCQWRPERPYFTTVPLLGLPKISAPRLCQLCGTAIRDWRALAGHCHREHGGSNEYRKRLFGEADRCHALGLPSVRKPNMVANATTAMLYSSLSVSHVPTALRSHVAQASGSRRAKCGYAENVATPFVCATA